MLRSGNFAFRRSISFRDAIPWIALACLDDGEIPESASAPWPLTRDEVDLFSVRWRADKGFAFGISQLSPTALSDQSGKKYQMAHKIAPCLWFSGNAADAAGFYARVFPDSRIDAINRSPSNYSGGAEGDVLTVEFTVLGMPFLGLNGGPEFAFDEAISFQIYTDDQAETDRYWHAIVDDGGSAGDCGWCKDRFGLSWQIVPRALMSALKSSDGAANRRAMDAMMQMKKIDIATIEAAAKG